MNARCWVLLGLAGMVTVWWNCFCIEFINGWQPPLNHRMASLPPVAYLPKHTKHNPLLLRADTGSYLSKRCCGSNKDRIRCSIDCAMIAQHRFFDVDPKRLNTFLNCMDVQSSTTQDQDQIPVNMASSPRVEYNQTTQTTEAEEVERDDWNDSTIEPTTQRLSVPSEEPSTTIPNAIGQALSIKEQVQQLKDSVNIVSVMESYPLQQFRRTGPHRATAICPFHDDHNPSLSIDSTKQIYKCFACGAGGDVVHFVQEYSKLPVWKPQEVLSFGQAIRYISTKFGDGTMGNMFSTYQSTQPNDSAQMLLYKKDRILSANAYAASFYSDCFKQPLAGGARYHLRSRGLSVTTWRTFAIGFAPDTYFDGRWTQTRGRGTFSWFRLFNKRDIGFWVGSTYQSDGGIVW
jgi:CHC2 zinc finger